MRRPCALRRRASAVRAPPRPGFHHHDATATGMGPSPERVATAGGATNARIASSPHLALPAQARHHGTHCTITVCAARRHGARRNDAACGSPSRHALHHGTFRADASCGRRATEVPCMITAHPAPMCRACGGGAMGDACVAPTPCCNVVLLGDVVPAWCRHRHGAATRRPCGGQCDGNTVMACGFPGDASTAAPR